MGTLGIVKDRSGADMMFCTNSGSKWVLWVLLEIGLVLIWCSALIMGVNGCFGYC